MATKIDNRFIAMPSDGYVYVVKGGEYVPVNILDMSTTWSPSIGIEKIVIALDEDMTPYQLKGTNVEVNVNG